MKKLLLSAIATISTIAAVASTGAPAQALEYDWADTDTIAYFVAAKSYLQDSKFSYEDGDFLTYDMGICRTGDKVVFTNLFDSYDANASMPLHDIPLEGVYDAAAGTITVEVEQLAVKVWDKPQDRCEIIT